MHNGTFKTLKQVVAFYNKGGGDDPNKDSQIRPLDLSKAEQADLVAFLESLSGLFLTGDDFVWKGEIPDDYPAIKNWRKVRN
jgi:cytochrome c peroxidase